MSSRSRRDAETGPWRELCEGFSALTGAGTAVLDLEGAVLAAAGWREICARFHRAHPETARRCLGSDIPLAGRPKAGERYAIHRCGNGLIEVSAPVTVDGELVARLFFGQFLLAPPDEAFFVRQAEACGFDLAAYLAALRAVPIFTEGQVDRWMTLFSRMARLTGDAGRAGRRWVEREAYVAALVENSPVAMLTWSAADRRVGLVNRTFRELFGFAPGDVPTVDHWWRLAFPDDRYRGEILGRWSAMHAAAAGNGGRVGPLEAEMRCSDGTSRRIEFRCSDIGTDHVVTFVDLTERRRAQRAFALLDFALDHVREAALLIDENGRFGYVNDEACRILGYSREELLRLHIADIDPDFPAERWPEHWREIKACGSILFEGRHRSKDGRVFPVEISANYFEYDGRGYNLGLVRDITGRREAEEARRRSQIQLEKSLKFTEALLSAIPTPVFYKDEAGRYLGCNRAFTAVMGVTSEEMKGKTVFELWPGEMARTYHEKDLELMRRPARQVYEYKVRDKDGRERPVVYVKDVFRDEGDRVAGLVGAFLDITDLKRAEDELRAERGLFVSGPTVVFKWRAATGWPVEYVSPNVADQFGYRPEELTGGAIPYASIVHPDDLARVAAEVAAYSAQGAVSFEQSYRIARADGIYRWIEDFTTVIRGRDGKISHYLGYVLDITERKRAARALEESEAKLRGILDNLDLGVVLVNPRMEILEMNRRMRAWFPAVDPDRHPLCHRAFSTPPREAPCVGCPLARTLRDGQTREGAVRVMRTNGLRDLRLVTTAILDHRGDVVAAVVMNEDITERLALEERLKQAQRLEAIGRLAGGVAHDFNNMLGVIFGNTELALKDVDPSDSLFAALQEIKEAVERSADLTRQLLTFARRQTVAPVALDLNRVVDGTLKMLKRLIGENIELAWLPGTGLRPVRMDPSQVDQILANLCVNARDAIQGVGRITIETRNVDHRETGEACRIGIPPGEYVLLAVGDSGAGMDQETRAMIFEPFFTTKTPDKGTGLGLATVYGIVKQNGGVIDVESEPGQGTVFRLYLPALTSEAVPVTPAGGAAPPPTGTETILLVEDEPQLLKIARRIMKNLGYTVLAADSPEEALRIAREHSGTIHLLVTDVVMPAMSGRDLQKALLAVRPEIGCLFVSSYTSNVIARNGILEPGVHFLQKPYSTETLSLKLREALSARPGP